MRWSRTRWVALGLGLGCSVLIGGLWRLGVLDRLEGGAFDLAMFLRGPEELPQQPGVAIVAIDEASLREIGRWPWPRSRLADLLRAVRGAGARVLALDLVMPEPSHIPPECDCDAPRQCDAPQADPVACRLTVEDCALAQAIAEREDVVLGYFLESEPTGIARDGFDVTRHQHYDLPAGVSFPDVAAQPAIQTSLPCFHLSTKHHGFVTHPRDRGAFRQYLLIQRLGGEELREDDVYLLPLALSAVARYKGALAHAQQDWGGAPEIYLGLDRLPADVLGRLAIDYLGGTGTIPTVSAADLLGDSPSETARRALEGSLVFIGLEASGLVDSHPTPFEELMPGVEIHATVAYNLLVGRYLHEGAVQGFVSALAILLLGAVVAVLVTAIERYLVGSLVAIGLVAVWPVIAYVAFDQAHWHLLFVAPMLAGVLSLVSTLRYQLQLGSRFEGYVSPNVARAIRRDPELARRSRLVELTVLFTDIRGFSTRTEEMGSEQVVRLLNDFFTPMTQVVLDQDGTLDKYMGDALMAFFGAPVPQPDHAVRACRAALAMRRELHVIRRSRKEMEELDIGIGVNTGEMTVGDMGSKGLFDYTVIGRNVNLGQRLEAATKEEAFGAGILVAETTREAAGELFLFRKVARLQAKGFKEPVTLYELIAERPEPGLEPPGWIQPELVRQFEQAYALYYPGRDFAAAEAAFRKLREKHPDDGPSKYYEKRCRELQEDPPPAEWAGVEEQTRK